MDGRRLLLVDHDEHTRSALRALYERSHAVVTDAATAAEGLRALYRTRPDVILLDVALAGGWQLIDRIRELTDVPILVLSASDDEADKVRALRAGADDYVTKPFGHEELLARTTALLRRGGPQDERPASYADALVEVDFEAAEARAAGRPLQLTPLEFRLLTTFVRNPNRVLSADDLLGAVWHEPGAPRRRVKLTVRYLREKFHAQGVEAPIETIRGFGYRYRPVADPTEALGASVDDRLAAFEPVFRELDDLRGTRGQRFFPSEEARRKLAEAIVGL